MSSIPTTSRLPSTIPKHPRHNLTARERKSQRAIDVFPIGRILPTRSAPCARYRLKRKDKRKCQALEGTMEELKARLAAVEARCQELLEMRQHLYLLSAQINNLYITVSAWIQQLGPKYEEPALEVHFPAPQARKPSSLPDFLIHRQHIPPDSSACPLLEIVSRPSSSCSSLSSTSTTSTSSNLQPSARPSSPYLTAVTAPVTAFFYCANIKDVLRNSWQTADSLDRIRRAIRKRRHTRTRRPHNPHIHRSHKL